MELTDTLCHGVNRLQSLPAVSRLPETAHPRLQEKKPGLRERKWLAVSCRAGQPGVARALPTTKYTSSDKSLNRQGWAKAEILPAQAGTPRTPLVTTIYQSQMHRDLVTGVCVCVCVGGCVLSRVRLFVNPQTVACQAPLSMGFSKQEYWSGLPFPSPEELPDPGIEPASPALQADL